MQAYQSFILILALVIQALFPVDDLTTLCQYDAADRIELVNGVGYTWDDNGNLLADGVNTFTYDTANRLTAVNGQGTSFTYAYDGLGNRYQQTANGQTTTYALDLAGGLSQVLSDGTNTYLYGLDRLAQQNASGKGYFLPDGLGSVRQIANASGMAGDPWAYDPFGGSIGSSGSSAYGFAGEWTDGTGLQYLRARYYSPEQGRFITRDPFPGILTQPSSLAPYPYALNNPATLTDPSGKFVPIIAIAGIGFAAGALYDAYQQTNGFTNFCDYDIVQTLVWGAGGAAAATSAAILAVTGVGYLGLGLQGAALGLSGLGITSSLSTSLFIAGTASIGWSGTAMAWLFSQHSQWQSSEIDRIRQTLSGAATHAQQSVGNGNGHAYGSRVHTAFAQEVKALGRSDLFTEVSYHDSGLTRFGAPGSIRIDVVYGSRENPIAVFDLKTGGATLSSSRILQIQNHLPFSNIPIYEVSP